MEETDGYSVVSTFVEIHSECYKRREKGYPSQPRGAGFLVLNKVTYFIQISKILVFICNILW